MANQSSSDPPLDEIRWSSPQHAFEMQGIHSNSILFYFAASPFYDRTSNNAILLSQAMYNPNMLPIVQTREAFEARLKTMSGLEFMVAQEPAEMAPGTGTGVWVIRKQMRRKKLGEEDEVKVLQSYFVVGENVYMAPSVGDVLGSRMLTVMASLQKFVSSAAALPNFSPALGHTYIPPTATKTKSDTQLSSQVSKETTPLPNVIRSSTASTNKTSTKLSSEHTPTSILLSQRLLEDSLNIYLKYGDEYMDENPITGGPGEFHLSSTGRKDTSKLSIPASSGTKGGPLQPPSSKPTPPTLSTTNISTDPAAKKGDKSPKTPMSAGKPKRRKSKANIGTPGGGAGN